LLWLTSAIPPPRKTPTRFSPRLAPFKTAIDEMLRADPARLRSSATPRGGYLRGW
jgi:hypothetical protein